MKLLLYSIGKANDSLLGPATDHFTGRLSHYFPVEWKHFSPPKNAGALGAEALKNAEAQLVLTHTEPGQFIVLLEETGKQLSSPALAEKLEHLQNAGTKSCIFIIAGAFGAGAALKMRANFMLSLGPMVYPHMLVRLILAEQLYRAGTILKNEKYHHS